MKASEILEKVDHTLLKATATKAEIDALCREALEYHTASVCIPPSYVKYAREAFGPRLRITTVIGFPLGYDTTEIKLFAALNAVQNGADEIDLVINIGDAKNGDFAFVTAEIGAIKRSIGDKILKVIVEACYLTEEEKIALCHSVEDGGADYIKTSTGFGTAGATHDDIALFKANLTRGTKIKAAGGIRTVEDMKKYVEEGCDRLGCSGAVALLKDKINEEL